MFCKRIKGWISGALIYNYIPAGHLAKNNKYIKANIYCSHISRVFLVASRQQTIHLFWLAIACCLNVNINAPSPNITKVLDDKLSKAILIWWERVGPKSFYQCPVLQNSFPSHPSSSPSKSHSSILNKCSVIILFINSFHHLT